MRASGWITLALMVAAVSAMAITPVPTTPPPLTPITISNAAGNQVDPHVSGNLVVFTSRTTAGSEIQYYDLATGLLQSIPNNGADDFSPDVHGTTIAFTRDDGSRPKIYAVDVAAGGPPLELDPSFGSRRIAPAIGGTTVAWRDVSGDASGEIFVYDIATGAPAQRLTNDTVLDHSPAVSPDGSVVVWNRCFPTHHDCDTVQAVRGPGGWIVGAPPAGPQYKFYPDTDGTILVYLSPQPGFVGGSDVHWTMLGSSLFTRVEIPGNQEDLSVSRMIAVFSGPAGATGNHDLFAYDVLTNKLYQLTNTPGLFEGLCDVWVSPTGEIRVVWSVLENTDSNVYGVSFRLRPVPAERLTASPEIAVNRIGTNHTMTVEVTDRTGTPAPAATVVFQVSGSVNTTGQCVTGSNGQCAVTYFGPKTAGTDRILIFADVNGNGYLDGPEIIGPCPELPCNRDEPWAQAMKLWIASGADGIDQLIALVDSLNTSRGTATSLRAKLQAARRAAENGNVALACRLIDAFKQEIQAQAGKALTTEEANQLLAAAEAIQTALGCP